MAKKHSPDQYAAWARDWGIDGFEHWELEVKRESTSKSTQILAAETRKTK